MPSQIKTYQIDSTSVTSVNAHPTAVYFKCGHQQLVYKFNDPELIDSFMQGLFKDWVEYELGRTKPMLLIDFDLWDEYSLGLN